jgi:NAD-dependent SIR2 family protein deacetylase
MSVMATSAAGLADPPAEELLGSWLRSCRRIFVLTGAGISTGSGIPDYRGPDGVWKRRAPITFQQFTGDRAMRARYWARSYVGWPAVARARPNAAHHALARLEALGRVSLLVTQNVDGLHQQAGQLRIVDLHGRIDGVVCLRCGATLPRDDLQAALAAARPDWRDAAAAIAPDGDADVAFVDDGRDPCPPCAGCGGLLKPDVVFFGENVPRERVTAAFDALANADAMLVVGSSLAVYSGYRFARQAAAMGIPLAILNRGVTRADMLATLKLDADCGPVLDAAIGTLVDSSGNDRRLGA